MCLNILESPEFVGAETIVICLIISVLSFSLVPDFKHVSLDWNPKAIQCYQQKVAEEFSVDESYRSTTSHKNQSVSLRECFEFYTSQEKIGKKDAW